MESASVNISDGRKTRSALEPVGVRRDCNEYCIASSLWDVTRNHTKEITKQEFKQMWDETQVVAETRYEKWSSGVVVHAFAEEVSDNVEIDFPHCLIDGNEKSILHGSPFFLKNDKHLTSPAACSYARRKIDEAMNELGRCSHLFEECDRRYVEHKMDALKSLKKKFNL